MLLHSPTELFEPKLINIKVDKQIIQLSESDIDYIQSFGNYVKVFVGSKYYLASTTTQEILSDLSSKLFVRIHKSFAINWTKVSDYTEKEVFILDKKLPIGITFKRKFMDRMEKVG
ncbi:LytR/AlgR family response regulator transcription factor [Flavobacterium agricola]|uniref:LytR/AlgR family response regulator transcription factor n=1 Tax=Flavobacterium agricola TaxID=2870839 RepID=UPI00222214F9|nr:LytTR family DNA-binding domain-containing protein [Flavobacterium agricola]